MVEMLKEFIHDHNGAVSMETMVLTLVLSCIAGVYLFAVYKLFTRSEFYSKDFNVTLTGLVVVVSAIMLAMQSNLIVSLGMVGALSIVRFRTAVKNPLDLLYLFWAISCGIICGIGLYALAAMLCAIMTVLVFIEEKIPNSRAPMVLVLRSPADADRERIASILSKMTQACHEKSVIIQNGEKECIYEVRVKEKESLASELGKIPGLSVTLVEHHGEYRG